MNAHPKKLPQPSTHLEVVHAVHAIYPHAPGFFEAIPLERRFNAVFKRAFDMTGAALLLLFLFSWLCPLLALLIRLDSKGPVFFVQRRHKKGGRVFPCLKFRTMYMNDQADSLPACADDGRITYMGTFLRQSHLDELPQLLNVLWGDMSLVGPRPYMLSENLRYERQVEGYPLRLRVKPGMTGLAQASGHFGYLADGSKMQQRVELDLRYIRSWSPWLDLMIVCRTLRTIRKSRI